MAFSPKKRPPRAPRAEASAESSRSPRARRPQKPSGKAPASRQRRSASQPNLEVKHSGKNGALLQQALQTPPQGKGAYDLTHGFHPYPGRFHPHLVRSLLEALKLESQGKGPPVVFDPFMGGGTTLIEAMQLGLATFGNDLNPIAALVTKERCRLRSTYEAEYIMEIVTQLRETIIGKQSEKHPSLIKRKYADWLKTFYPPHLFVELLLWIEAIDALKSVPARETLQAVFSSLVVKFSHKLSDSSEKTKPVSFPKGAVSEWMFAKTEEVLSRQKVFKRRVARGTPAPRLWQENAAQLEGLPAGAVDVIITSPPYPGTYDYFQHHELRLKWLQLPYTTFEKEELGSQRRHSPQAWKELFRQSLLTMRRTLKPEGRCYIILGDWLDKNRRVDGLEFLRKYAPSVGWKVEASASVRRPILEAANQEIYGEAGKWEHLVELSLPPKFDQALAEEASQTLPSNPRPVPESTAEALSVPKRSRSEVAVLPQAEVLTHSERLEEAEVLTHTEVSVVKSLQTEAILIVSQVPAESSEAQEVQQIPNFDTK